MPTPLRAGEILRGRYRISRIIGQGGMGSIYLADDLRLEGRACALKEVEHDRSLPGDLFKQAREQFSREATVLAPRSPQPAKSFDTSRRAAITGDGFRSGKIKNLMNDARRKGISQKG
jgi:serine/threonine-protein kinase